MAKLAIPRSIRTGLLRIGSLTDEQFKELYSALERLPLRINQRTIFDYDGLDIKAISADDLDSIQEALFPIYVAQGTTNTLVSTYADDIIASLQEAELDSDGQRSQEAISAFKERFKRLLAIERPKLIAKAHDVLTGQKPTYLKSRIFTDIRPVFMDEVQTAPGSAVIIHMLRINYYMDDREHQFVVALDTNDVQQLIATLERARNKTETLNSIVAAANLKLIDVG